MSVFATSNVAATTVRDRPLTVHVFTAVPSCDRTTVNLPTGGSLCGSDHAAVRFQFVPSKESNAESMKGFAVRMGMGDDRGAVIATVFFVPVREARTVRLAPAVPLTGIVNVPPDADTGLPTMIPFA